MADLIEDIFSICSTPFKLYSGVLPKRDVTPPEEFYPEGSPNRVPPYETGIYDYER